MVTRHCVRVEPITTHWEGGHLCTGPCGRPHLHGRHWTWWHCPNCQGDDWNA